VRGCSSKKTNGKPPADTCRSKPSPKWIERKQTPFPASKPPDRDLRSSGKLQHIDGRDLAGDDDLNGAADNDEVYGGAGGDTVNGGSGDSIVWGATGDDTFVFSLGDDTFFGFDDGNLEDQIDMSGAVGITNTTDLLTNHLTTDLRGNAVITDDNGNSVTLQGVGTANLDMDNFTF